MSTGSLISDQIKVSVVTKSDAFFFVFSSPLQPLHQKPDQHTQWSTTIQLSLAPLSTNSISLWYSYPSPLLFPACLGRLAAHRTIGSGREDPGGGLPTRRHPHPCAAGAVLNNLRNLKVERARSYLPRLIAMRSLNAYLPKRMLTAPTGLNKHFRHATPWGFSPRSMRDQRGDHHATGGV